MNASPYSGPNSNKQVNDHVVRKEFDVDGTPVYHNSTRNEINRGYSVPAKSTVTFTKKPLTTTTLSKSRAGNSTGQDFLYGIDNDNRQLYTSNYESEQKKQNNDDFEFADLENNDNYYGKTTVTQSQNFGYQGGFNEGGNSISNDNVGLTRPGTSTGK